MKEKRVYDLKVDYEFKSLIRPPSEQEYQQLECNILEDGCREPLVVWNGVIVDGHNRYEICRKHNIPFAVEEKDFSCREAVIAWICSNQLGRRNITEETRKFLIGKQYNAEKIVGFIRNKRGLNQYSEKPDNEQAQEKEETEMELKPLSGRAAERIATDHHISPGTVQKYARFARAVEKIDQTEPQLAQKLLEGTCKVSQENIVALSEMTPREIRRFHRHIDSLEEPFTHFKTTRREFQKEKDQPQRIPQPDSTPSVKNMPEYDPDAEVVGLTLTIPSWCGSIERARKNASMETVSIDAKDNLRKALEDLRKKIEEVIGEIGGAQ